MVLTLFHQTEHLGCLFSGNLGEFCIFELNQGILMFCILFLAILVWFSMLGMSIDLFDVSIWLSMPSVTSMLWFASPVARCVLTSSPWLILAVSALFDTFEASVWAPEPSVRPLDPSSPFPGPSALPVCICMPPRHTHGISPLPRLSDWIDIVTSISGSFGVSTGSAPWPGLTSAMPSCWQHSAAALSMLACLPIPLLWPFDLLDLPLRYTVHFPLSGSPFAIGMFSFVFPLHDDFLHSKIWFLEAVCLHAPFHHTCRLCKPSPPGLCPVQPSLSQCPWFWLVWPFRSCTLLSQCYPLPPACTYLACHQLAALVSVAGSFTAQFVFCAACLQVQQVSSLHTWC